MTKKINELDPVQQQIVEMMLDQQYQFLEFVKALKEDLISLCEKIEGKNG